MTATIHLQFTQPGRAPITRSASTAIELGRADPTRPSGEPLFDPLPGEGCVRIAIARADEIDVSRRQARLEPLPNGRVKITNLSGSVPLRCFDQPAVAPGATEEHDAPLRFQVGRLTIVAALVPEQIQEADDVLQTLEPPAPPLGDSWLKGGGSRITGLETAAGTVDAAALVRWWRQVIAVLQSATNSNDFFHRAAEALVDLVGLHLGAVFLHGQDGWQPVAISTRSDSRARPSTSVLARVLAERRTFFNRVPESVDVLSSLAQLEAFVAAPILDRHGQVLAALYGHRENAPGGQRTEITPLEALVVETLASGVAAGLARLEQERSARARKVQFEQFFSASLAEKLEADPGLLRGRDAEITVLFCDIRGFSSVTERLGPAQTMEWIGGVLTPLSDVVAAEGGVLVDYVGDELLAMWGAPTPQADHAVRACRAARGMSAALARIDAEWEAVVGFPTRVGIGISTATARVGNTGSARKFKYGPLGNGVNLGSRVQGATKFLKVNTILTGATRRLLDDGFRVRRLCTVRVVNIEEPVDLYEPDWTDDPARGLLFARYDEALTAFETGRFSDAAGLLGGLLSSHPQDGPSLVLLSRAVEAMVREPAAFSPVWTLPGK